MTDKDAGVLDEPGIRPTDAVRVRVAETRDLDAIVTVDEKHTGRRRREYYKRRLAEAMAESDIRVSLVAELDGRVAGFLLGRVYYGEFGMPERAAVIDAIGVDPGARGKQVGAALLHQLGQNLRALHVERVQTLVDWTQMDLLAFLARAGFRPAPRLCLEVEL